MSAPVVAFFNNKGGVGKTSLVYHLAWMYADLGLTVVAADLDPQANLSAAFLEEERLEELWPEGPHPHTIFGAVRPLQTGEGDTLDPHLEGIGEEGEALSLIVGDPALSNCEDEMSDAWSRCLVGDLRSFLMMSAFWRLLKRAADERSADIVLVDLGPNLGAVNRAALLASDHIVFPLLADLFSLQSLKNLGPTLRRWRTDWRKRLAVSRETGLDLPAGHMHPIGYVVLQHSVRLDRPELAYARWSARIPEVYRSAVLTEISATQVSLAEDPYCLVLLKHYRSLMPLAQEARKPMFHLKPADGAIGAYVEAVRGAYEDFMALAHIIAERIGLKLR